MTENNGSHGTSKIHKRNNILILLCMILLLIIVFVGGYYIGKTSNDNVSINVPNESINDNNNDNDDNENTSNDDYTDVPNESVNDNDNGTDNETNENKNTIVDIPIDDNIKNLYSKYHTSDDSKINDKLTLTRLTVETLIYKQNFFSIKQFEITYVPHSYYVKILDKMKAELDSYSSVDGTENLDELFKKYFKEFFGDNLIYSDKIQYESCIMLHYENGSYSYVSGCGDVSGTYATYELIAAKKDDNNIYLYENVIISDYTGNQTNSFIYKWTYSKGKDNNYYLLEIERV